MLKRITIIPKRVSCWLRSIPLKHTITWAGVERVRRPFLPMMSRFKYLWIISKNSPSHPQTNLMQTYYSNNVRLFLSLLSFTVFSQAAQAPMLLQYDVISSFLV